MSHASTLKKVYFDWLLKETHFTNLDNDIVEISVPFLDNDFDYIIMYAQFHRNNTITLTDDGWTLAKLKGKGLPLTHSKKVKNLLEDITTSFGINLAGYELSITTSVNKFPLAKQRLLQTIMQVNDLEILINSKTKHVFFEEIESFLSDHDILYSRRPSFAGKEGITVQFDFAIPTPNREKLIRTISNGNDLNRSKLLTMDTQLLKNHKHNADYIAIIDDVENKFEKESEVDAIFRENSGASIHPLLFSKLSEQIEKIAN